MKKNAINNDTTIFSMLSAFIVYTLNWFWPEFVGGFGGMEILMTGLLAAAARQVKYFFVDRKQQP